MKETSALDMLARAGESTPQQSPRKKVKGGDFASQFMAMLFDDSMTRQAAATAKVGAGRESGGQGQGRGKSHQSRSGADDRAAAAEGPRSGRQAGVDESSLFRSSSARSLHHELQPTARPSDSRDEQEGREGEEPAETRRDAEGPATGRPPVASAREATPGRFETQPRESRGQTLPPESLWRPSRGAEDLRVDHASAAQRQDHAPGADAPAAASPKGETERIASAADLALQSRSAGRHHLGSAEQVPDVPSSRLARRDGATSDQEGATAARIAEGARPNPTHIPERETLTDQAALQSTRTSPRTSIAGPERQTEGAEGRLAAKPSLTDLPGTSPALSALGTELVATLTSGQRARQMRPGQSGTHQARETRTMAAGSELEEKRSERPHSEPRLSPDPKASAASSGSQTTRGHHGSRSESHQSSAAQNGESVQEPDSREMARDAGSRPELESADGRRKEAEPIRTVEGSSRAHETTSVREHFQPVVHSVAATVSKSDPVATSPRVAAGQAPQHAAGTADAGQIFDQIVETAKLDRTIGLDRFTVQLKPGFLGRIEIQTEMSEDAAMHAVIRVEDPTVRKAVETGLTHLVSKLNELGLEIASAKVADFLPQQDGQGQQHSGSGSSSSKGRQFSSTIEGPAATAGVEENLTAGDDGSVSYFV